MGTCMFAMTFVELKRHPPGYKRSVAVIVQDAWASGQEPLVHGWVISLANGL